MFDTDRQADTDRVDAQRHKQTDRETSRYTQASDIIFFNLFNNIIYFNLSWCCDIAF